ncbi:hypothetical protein GL2_33190 [Microbulbifer sp. GL-2]|nr:hypothetical protein GL2_33190 [Microbulbifer sp. GL-2]
MFVWRMEWKAVWLKAADFLRRCADMLWNYREAWYIAATFAFTDNCMESE